MAVPNKDTIYVDVDDEITAIIDKIRSSDAKVIALVLPKRAAMLQSIVNMKLLKRTADNAKKNLVLITTDPSLMPLAAAVGLHVAPTPQSKPEIPVLPSDESGDAPLTADDDDAAYTAEAAGNRSIGELARAAGAGASGVETLDLADDEQPEEEPVADELAPKRDRRMHVPNFNRFRAGLFLGILLLILAIIGIYAAIVILPKATIAVTTNASTVNVNLTALLDPSAKTLDAAKGILPAKVEQQEKTMTQQVNTTGQKNTGAAATGTVTMSAQTCAPYLGQPAAVPAGTGVSTNGLTFITQSAATFNFDHFSSGNCAVYKTSAITIDAQSPGAKYNVSSVTFSVANRSDVTATGSTSGGTDNIVQVVTQSDIDGATQKLASQDTSAIKAALEQTLRQDGLYPLPATFGTGTPTTSSSNSVGEQVATVTVTQVVTYTMYGVQQSDLESLLKANIGGQIDTTKQGILDDGLSSAKIATSDSAGAGEHVAVQTVATVGPDISAATIKKESMGKKAGDIKSQLNAVPGVTGVDVHLSPFWVSTVPTNPSKVTVTITGAKTAVNGGQ